MPQIWMSYDELAELFGTEADVARQISFALSLDHRRSRDGVTRVKLSRELQTRFVAAIIDSGSLLRDAARELREVHERMSRSGLIQEQKRISR